MIIEEKFLKAIKADIDKGDFVTKNIKVHSSFDQRMKLLKTIQPRLSNDDIINAALSVFFSNNSDTMNKMLLEENKNVPSSIAA